MAVSGTKKVSSKDPYREGIDMYHRERSNDWRSRNTGVIVKAGPNASKEELRRLSGKSSTKEHTLINFSGYDNSPGRAERARRIARQEEQWAKLRQERAKNAVRQRQIMARSRGRR